MMTTAIEVLGKAYHEHMRKCVFDMSKTLAQVTPKSEPEIVVFREYCEEHKTDCPFVFNLKDNTKEHL